MDVCSMKLAVCLCLTLLLGACVPHRAFRCLPGEQVRACLPSVAGESNHKIAFVEFNDEGELWSKSQLDQALALIDSEAARAPEHQVAVLTFVHGWKSNAGSKKNVRHFEEALAGIDTSKCRTFFFDPALLFQP